MSVTLIFVGILIKEKDIENSILEWLQYQPNVMAFKINTMGVYDPIGKRYRRTHKYVRLGVSDILGMAFGKFLAIEVKTPLTKKRMLGNHPSDTNVRQKHFLEDVQRLGGIGLLVSSLEEVVEAFQKLRTLYNSKNP